MFHPASGVCVLRWLHGFSLTPPTLSSSICLEFLPCPILCCNRPKAASLLTNGVHSIQRGIPHHCHVGISGNSSNNLQWEEKTEQGKTFEEKKGTREWNGAKSSVFMEINGLRNGIKAVRTSGNSAHAFKPSTPEAEAEAEGSLWVQGQPGQHSKFQASLT